MRNIITKIKQIVKAFNDTIMGNYETDKNIVITNSCYHECGHTIVAYIFRDIFETEFVSLKNTAIVQYDPKAIGGLKGKTKKKFVELTNQELDMLFLIYLAGFCTEEIVNSNMQITDDFFDPQVFLTKLANDSYGGDCDYMHSILCKLFNIQINPKKDVRPYYVSSLNFLYNILTDKIVFQILTSLAIKLTKSPQQTMSGVEIATFLDNTEFPKWIKINEKKIFGERKKLYD